MEELTLENRYFGAHLNPLLGPPIPQFLRKHPHVAKRKIRDTVIETKTQYAGRKITNKRQNDDNTNLKPMIERQTTQYNL